MRHRVAKKQLGRTTSHRKALRRNMAASLFEHGAIRTTEAKAKELRRYVEKLITIAKKGDLHARRRVIQILQDRAIFEFDEEKKEYTEETNQTVIQKLFTEIAPRYAERNGGYTRIIRLADRRIGDAGVQVILQLVEEEIAESSSSKGSSKRRKRAAKRFAAVGAVAKAAAPAEEAPAEEAPAEEQTAEAPADESSEEAGE